MLHRKSQLTVRRIDANQPMNTRMLIDEICRQSQELSSPTIPSAAHIGGTSKTAQICGTGRWLAPPAHRQNVSACIGSFNSIAMCRQRGYPMIPGGDTL